MHAPSVLTDEICARHVCGDTMLSFSVAASSMRGNLVVEFGIRGVLGAK